MPFYIQPDNPTVLPWITDVSRLFCVFRFPSVISNECSISWRHDSEVKFRLHIVSVRYKVQYKVVSAEESMFVF